MSRLGRWTIALLAIAGSCTLDREGSSPTTAGTTAVATTGATTGSGGGFTSGMSSSATSGESSSSTGGTEAVSSSSGMGGMTTGSGGNGGKGAGGDGGGGKGPGAGGGGGKGPGVGGGMAGCMPSPTTVCCASDTCTLANLERCCLDQGSPDKSTCVFDAIPCLLTVAMSCDDSSDCPNNQLCCGGWSQALGYGNISCQDPATCDTFSERVICGTPSGFCRMGETCQPDAKLGKGHGYCN